MEKDLLEKIIQESVRKAERLPDGSFKKECIWEGIYLLIEARGKLRNQKKLKNPVNNNNEINLLISQGLTLVYHEQYKRNKIRIPR